MDDAADSDDELVGTTLAEAAARVADQRESVDEGSARVTLSSISDEGEITIETIHDAVAYAAKVVSTPATRAEFAALDIEDARDAASDVDDVDAVAARLDGFDERLAAIDSRVADLDTDLQQLVARAGERANGDVPDDVYAFAQDLNRLQTAANEQQGAADELAMEAEAFERWLSSPSERVEELTADVEELATAVDRLADDVEAVAAANGDADLWFDCTLRRRVLELQVRDLRAEVRDLETLADRADNVPAGHHDDLTDAVERLDDFGAAVDEAARRLDDAASPEWYDHFEERLEALDDDLDAVSPPVPWGRVLRALEAAREE
ncbi:hypothetical protein [Halobaculum gomorrense]|uniref:Halo transducer protein n=1 Tax=Halobaculum gomorrense TaxID=43928 RepID=A0A1M5KG04_9EURY|nr:hypothetical protein [Halobaculum gomorrense]SHG51732.1 hypothetical protein SAMN05443636_0497 [Halobaculum gomorrense]